MAHFEGVKGNESCQGIRLSEFAARLKSVKRNAMISAAVLVFATEFRQSTSILLDKELRKTKRGAALLGSSLVSGFMIGSSFTSIGSQVVAAYSSKPIDLTYGDIVFAAGIAIQTIIHFVKKKIKQNA